MRRSLREDFEQRLKEAGQVADWHYEEETQEEYAIVDRSGRVQLPREMLDQLGLEDNKVLVEYTEKGILICKP